MLKIDSQMPQPLLEVTSLTLRIPIFRPLDRKLLSNPSRLLSDLYLSRTRRASVTLLDNIAFSIKPGERLGLIGVNGSGKSTLLRVLAGIYVPTTGTLTVNGTAKGMFDISMGMHTEATGLENIYMRGLQMGLNLQEIKTLIPEIIEFSELKEVIDNPFNTYSTGMRMRLAFSISTMIDPDILLLDEWIGAGDAGFRRKINNRMDSLIEQSRGLVVASHNTSLMKDLCTHGLVLSNGSMIFCGGLAEALERYQKEINPKS